MQKKIILLSICSVLVLSAQAQGFKGGLHLGLLATQVDGDNHAGYKKLGLFAGVFTNYSFLEKEIQLQFELNYAQKGSANKTIYRMALQQVEPTVLLDWRFWEGFSLEAGLAFNILVSAKEYTNQVLIPKDVGSNFYLFNADGIVGLKFQFREHWGTSLRFSYSTPIGRINKSHSSVQRGVSGYIWNNCLLFRVYYQF